MFLISVAAFNAVSMLQRTDIVRKLQVQYDGSTFTFNLSTPEEETGEYLNSRPAWNIQ